MLWYRIPAATAPGVAAGNALYCQPRPLYWTIFFKSLKGIMAAGGRVPALWAQVGAYYPLVKLYKYQKRKR